MVSSHKAVLSRLRSARIDGRTENLRYRQSQLQYLHRELCAVHDEIRGAIRKDASFTAREADVEFASAMSALKDAYEGLNFDQALDEEYNPARGLDYLKRRSGVGIVYIKPANSFPFFNVLAPVVAAIAAGNCILIQLDGRLRYLPDLLRTALGKSLDPDAFAIVEGNVKDDAFLAEALQVVQVPSADDPLLANELRSRVDAPTVAVVDRTADLAVAARTIVRARTAFNGVSSYSPDLVLVNEFVKKPFLELVAQELEAIAIEVNKDRPAERRASDAVDERAESDADAKIVARSGSCCVVDVSSRSSTLLHRKVSEQTLLTIAMTSLEDAIDFLNSSLDESTNSQGSSYLASYIFAQPPTAKYLSHFIRADASFINAIPSALLVGPAAPSFPQQPLDINRRYTPEMFSICRPQAANESTTSKQIGRALFTAEDASSSKKEALSASQLADLAIRPLKPTGQPLQHARIGFFEQGIITGLGLAATPILIGIGTGAWFGARYLWFKFR